MKNEIFEDLFVLEMASNHQGSLDRGLQIISAFSKVVRFNNIRAAIKLQFRDIDNFVHKDFIGRDDIRYVKRLADTKMSKENFAVLVEAIRKSGCIPMSTPFDEKSVDWCVEFDMPIIKVASADNNDWTLLEKIATTKKPVVISTGGMTQKDMDDVVHFFASRNIELALNHCIAAYPHEDNECELLMVRACERLSAILILMMMGFRWLLIHHCPHKLIHGLRRGTRRKKCAEPQVIIGEILLIEKLLI